jgi:hypothetical protein
MEPPKYPKDFEGWRPIYKMHDNRYLILESPDGTMEACIHLEDDDVVGIKDKATGMIIYDGNLTLAKKIAEKLWRNI